MISTSSASTMIDNTADQSSLTPKEAAKPLFPANLPKMLFTYSHSGISPV